MVGWKGENWFLIAVVMESGPGNLVVGQFVQTDPLPEIPERTFENCMVRNRKGPALPRQLL